MYVQTNDGQVIHETDCISIYDIERREYRLTVYEEDGVLRLVVSEPVVIVTEEEDLEARHKREVAQRVDDMIEDEVKKDKETKFMDDIIGDDDCDVRNDILL